MIADLPGWDPDPRVVSALCNADASARRRSSGGVYASAYRIYQQPDGIPVIRIAPHEDRAEVAR